jgi:hypothetical protein
VAEVRRTTVAPAPMAQPQIIRGLW